MVMREQSPSDIYHVMARGNWKQITFNDDVEREKFLQLLAIEKEKYEIELHCYCLMDNHFHLLIKAQPDEMSFFMRDLQAAYARFYNWKNGRVGHLFQGVYKSEPIDTDEYYRSAFRYILRNPEAAGVCKTEEYQWSSYEDFEFLGGLTDVNCAMEIIGSYSNLADLLAENDDHHFLEPERKNCDDLENISAFLKRNFSITDLKNLENLSVKQQTKIIKSLKNQGVSVLAISELFSISARTVYNRIYGKNKRTKIEKV